MPKTMECFNPQVLQTPETHRTVTFPENMPPKESFFWGRLVFECSKAAGRGTGEVFLKIVMWCPFWPI